MAASESAVPTATAAPAAAPAAAPSSARSHSRSFGGCLERADSLLTAPAQRLLAVWHSLVAPSLKPVAPSLSFVRERQAGVPASTIFFTFQR
eukprot:1041882-Pleurochrysis_carterae.AAC.1